VETDRHNEVNGRFSQFCQCAFKKLERWTNLS